MSEKTKKPLKRRIFDIIQIGNKDDLISRFFDWFIVIVIILNILTVFLETFDELESFTTLFRVIEIVTIFIFCIEYILRIWTADYLYPSKRGLSAKLKFLWSFDGIVDLLTILPFFFLEGFIVFRMLRVVRIFHLFRVNAHYDSFHVITTVLIEKKNQIISSVFIIIVLMLASSLGIYSVEHEAQPEAFSNAFSGIWWSVSTLLTVGYGDIYPITVIGKLMAICIAFLGVGVVAIPTGIISAGFVEQYTKNQHSDVRFSDINEVGEILIDKNSEFKGMRVSEASEKYNMRILVILRGDLTVVPMDELKMRQNDILIVKSEKLVKE
ncbi:ion transporter [Ruminococcus flavefaciens]|uniref:Voltage-gated potassium channel n=1 Tax=Ruminococcus flavefaciens TaxID=1265 RepID=A0A315Y607_RUMFL|nr:ion transporter [Ruminococcus flavefaciens]PWJ15403.1 voltage-gated potassium channel [Ruminococcus flavefaciens]SSA40536.1 voltage-gated potassium channel [Ruminococcus flavefaciens]